MSDRITGYNELTLQSLTTGAGVAFVDFDLATDTFDTGTKLGATSGGITITVEYPDAWDREIDGIPANSIGMRESEFVRPTVVMPLVEVANPSIISKAFGAHVSEQAAAPDGYTVVSPLADIATSHYLKNITVFTQTKGSAKPLIIVLENPLSTEGFEFATESRAGGSIEVTFTGNFDPLALDKPPIKIYTPAQA